MIGPLQGERVLWNIVLPFAGGRVCFKGWFGVTSKGLKGAGLLTTGADFDLKNFEGGFLVGWTATGTTGTANGCVLIRFIW